jgi:uncharacterized protein (DUF952 family)
MRVTYHLVPLETWSATDTGGPFVAASLATEEFVHCTDGAGELAATFDRHCAADPRSFMALTLDLDAVGVPWRYDDPGSPYPHVYGPIPLAAILGVERVARDGAGRFARLVPA